MITSRSDNFLATEITTCIVIDRVQATPVFTDLQWENTCHTWSPDMKYLNSSRNEVLEKSGNNCLSIDLFDNLPIFRSGKWGKFDKTMKAILQINNNHIASSEYREQFLY